MEPADKFKNKWRKWFAWRPVELSGENRWFSPGEYGRAFLMLVERQAHYVGKEHAADGSGWAWVYRRLGARHWLDEDRKGKPVCHACDGLGFVSAGPPGTRRVKCAPCRGLGRLKS